MLTIGSGSIALHNVVIRGVLPALAGALLLAGCGSGSSSSAAAASGGSTTAGLSAFQSCLKQHGVNVPAGPGQPSGRPTGSFSPGARPTGAIPSGTARPGGPFGGANSSAMKACVKYAPAGFGGGANGGAISSSALAAFKSCMTSKGVKVTGTTAGAVLSEFRSSTGKTATAFKTCQVLIRPAAPAPTASS